MRALIARVHITPKCEIYIKETKSSQAEDEVLKSRILVTIILRHCQYSKIQIRRPAYLDGFSIFNSLSVTAAEGGQQRKDGLAA